MGRAKVTGVRLLRGADPDGPLLGAHDANVLEQHIVDGTVIVPELKR